MAHSGAWLRIKVDPEAWGPFYDWIDKADAVLTQAKDYAADDPFWYIHRANLYNHMGVKEDVFSAFMQEALDRHPNFYQLYFAGVEYYAPKWHGDAELIDAFANDAIARTGAAEGNGLYARIYWYASQTQYGFHIITELYVVWSKMRDGIEDVLAQYPDQWNIQNFAVFACLANDVDMIRNLFSQMDGPPIMSAWRNTDMLDYCRTLADLSKGKPVSCLHEPYKREIKNAAPIWGGIRS